MPAISNIKIKPAGLPRQARPPGVLQFAPF
jgi:hypothetical protein